MYRSKRQQQISKIPNVTCPEMHVRPAPVLYLLSLSKVNKLVQSHERHFPDTPLKSFEGQGRCRVPARCWFRF